jgi:hypothetical protein
MSGKGEGRRQGCGWRWHSQKQGTLGDEMVCEKDDEFRSTHVEFEVSVDQLSQDGLWGSGNQL